MKNFRVDRDKTRTQILAATLLAAVFLAPSALGAISTKTLDRKAMVFDSALALDSSDAPIVAYFDGTAGTLKLAACQNAGCKGRVSITTLDTGGFGPSLALDPNGAPVISYQDSQNTLRILHCADPACTSVGSKNSLDAQDATQQSSLALNSSGNPVVSFIDVTNNKLKILFCGDPDCVVSNTISVVAVADLPDNLDYSNSLALDGDIPVVSFMFNDGAKDVLQVLRCGDSACDANTNTITTVDADGNYVGFYPSLKLDGDGNPVVSYIEEGTQELRVLHCGDSTCSSGNSILVPDSDPAEGPTSLALSGGNPVVAYAGPEALRILHCNDANCAGGDDSITIPIPPTSKSAAFPSSLALDQAGNPVVSYIDFVRSHNNVSVLFGVLFCGDANCTP